MPVESAISPQRMEALDLLRGIAALLVVALHFPRLGSAGFPLEKSYLAVDLFFLLSGFVIMHAYRARIAGGMGLRRFLIVRAIRLFPLYLAGTALCALIHGVTAARNGDGAALASIGTTLPFALTMLPTPPALSINPETYYPLNFPAWSLFFEFIVNAVFAAILGQNRVPRLPAMGAIALACAAVLVVQAARGQSLDTVQDIAGFWLGLPRAGFAFFLGVLLYRVRQRHCPPRTPGWLLGAGFVAWVIGGFGTGPWFDLASAFVVFPALIWLASNAGSGPAARKAGAVLGYLSYPVYVIHAGFQPYFERAFLRIAGLPSADVPLLGLPLFLSGSLLLAWIAARWIDAPVRGWLGARSARQSPAQEASGG